jgi:hypothetical protein
MGCLLGIPYDGETGFDPYNMFNDITKLLQAGFLLQFFVGALDMSRFAWLFSRYCLVSTSQCQSKKAICHPSHLSARGLA